MSRQHSGILFRWTQLRFSDRYLLYKIITRLKKYLTESQYFCDVSLNSNKAEILQIPPQKNTGWILVPKGLKCNAIKVKHGVYYILGKKKKVCILQNVIKFTFLDGSRLNFLHSRGWVLLTNMQRHRSVGTISRRPRSKIWKLHDYTLCMYCLLEIENVKRHVNQQQVNGHSFMKNHKLHSFVNLSFNKLSQVQCKITVSIFVMEHQLLL